jgi:Ca2+-binding RTX toxin-like protein
MQRKAVAAVAAALVTTGLTAPAVGSVAAGESAPVVTCGGIPATIVGKVGPEVLRGTENSDVIQSRGGDDVVLGLGGDDRICLGAGRDIAKGGAGNDEFHAEAALDGRDDFYGDAGGDAVRYIARDVGVSVNLDGVANDGQAGEQDNVHVSVENVQGTIVDDSILGNDLRNVFIGSSGDDDLRGGLERDKLFGLGGEDLLIGNADNDKLDGGDDSDTFIAASLPDGTDQVFGGDGFDTMSYEGRNAGFGVTVLLDNEFNDGSAGEFDDVRTDVEHVIGGAGRDTLEAGEKTSGVLNRLVGGLGNDTLRSVDGTFDVVDGGLSLDLCETDPGDREFNCEL